MKERPILFSTPMVRAILDGSKTVTRRVVDIDPELSKDVTKWGYSIFTPVGCISGRTIQKTETGRRYGEKWVKLKYGKEGDILWVRETLYQEGELGLKYVADNDHIDESLIPDDYGPYGGDYSFRSIPNIHMPKWACRLRLKIVSIRVERLHDITEEDAVREGVTKFPEGYIFENYIEDTVCDSAKKSFETLWASINGQDSWDSNPWVWRIEFTKL